MPTELARMTSMAELYASTTLRPACRVEPMMGTDLAGGGYRGLYDNDLTGTMPTELGLLTAVQRL